MLWPSQSWSDSFSQQYDSEIREAADVWWWSYDETAPDWLWWKAQLYQESRLDPAAVSPVGARGLAQFMPATWAEVSRELGWRNVSPHSARHAIFAGAYYMYRMRRFPDWRATAEPDKHQLAQAAYNAGAGNVRKALRLCDAAHLAGTGGEGRPASAGQPKARGYWAVRECLPQVTGRHARETLTYVDRIARWRAMMRGP